MKHAALEQYVLMDAHNGKNDKQILDKFLQYASQCSDPLNVLRQMESRSICIYQPAYWLTKADYLAANGDYANAFQCVDEAICRLGISEDPAPHPLPGAKIKSLTHMLISDMKLAPCSKKRTVREFDLLDENSQAQTLSHLVLLPIYQEKYQEAKAAKQVQFIKKRQPKPISKMGEDEKRNSIQNILQISSSRSCRIKDSINYSSLHTPMRTKDPMRLPKTRDSVQMLKKRKSTGEKSILKEDINPMHQCQKEEINEPVSMTFKSFPFPASTKSRSKMRKTVTFQVNSSRIEKVRHCDTNFNEHFIPQINHFKKTQTYSNNIECNPAHLLFDNEEQKVKEQKHNKLLQK